MSKITLNYEEYTKLVNKAKLVDEFLKDERVQLELREEYKVACKYVEEGVEAE